MAEPVEDPDEARLTAGVARRRWGFRVVLSGAIAAAFMVGWYFFLRQPSPEVVCANLNELRRMPEGGLVRQWLEVTALHDQRTPESDTWHDHCLWFFRTMRDHESMWQYGPKARCAADISQPGDITHCGF
jgi:hypothetical protein